MKGPSKDEAPTVASGQGFSEQSSADSVNCANTPAHRAASLKLRSDSHRVGAGLSVRFTFDADRFDAQWQPRTPTAREWRRVLSPYRKARDAFLQTVALRTGLNVTCVEVQP